MIVRGLRKKGCARPNRSRRPLEGVGSARQQARLTLDTPEFPRESGWLGLLPLHTLRSRLIVLIGVPLLLVQASVVGLEYTLGRADELSELELQLAQQTQLTATEIDMQLALVAEAARSHAGLLADNPQLGDYERHRILRRSVETHPSVHSAALAFEPWITHRLPLVYRPSDRQPIESIDLNRPDYDIRRESWYRRARTETEPFWIGPRSERTDRTVLVSCIAPILRNGGFAGTVTINLAVDTLRSQLARGRKGSGLLALIDPAGSVLVSVGSGASAAWPAELAKMQRQQPGHAEIARRITDAPGGVVRIPGQGSERRDRLLVQKPISTNDWSVLSLISESDALEDVNDRLLRQSLIYGFGTAGVLLLVWWLTVLMTRPLRALTEAARQVSEGSLDVRVEGPLARDEIGHLSMVFNQMVSGLKENIAARLDDATARQAVESELAIASKIQQSLLPKPAASTLAIDLAGDFIPARYVAGDFYDWFPVDPETVGVVIADVAGKGVPAALFMAVTRTSLRSYSADARGPAETLTALNRSLCEDNPLMMFVTVFYGHYHLPSGRLIYANAGHNSPYILRANGAVESLGDSTGPLLAVFADASIADGEAKLQQGDALVLYTDGVTDASDPDGRLYDEKRLELVLKNAAGESASEICGRIRYAVGDHCKGAPQDDVTLLVLRRNA